MFDPKKLLDSLAAQNTRFVIIGGVAAIAHGILTPTKDLDVCYDRKEENILALVRALETLHPHLRGENIPVNLPFVWDARTIKMGLNFTLETDAGPFDLLGEVKGLGGYSQALDASDPIELYGHRCRVLSLDPLIRTKKAAGRPRDVQTVIELEAIKSLKKKTETK